MTYGELKNYVLQLLNQYSTAGTLTPPTYNNQADYLARLPMSLVSARIDYCYQGRER